MAAPLPSATTLLESSSLAQLLLREATLSPRRAFGVAAIAGLSNAMILAVINTAVEHAQQSETRVLYVAAFAAALLIYIVSQRWILTQAAEQIEDIIHRVRIRILRRLRDCELLDVERLGRAVIYSGIARHMQTLSQSASTITIAVQMAVLIVFTTAYIAWLSLTSFLVLVGFMTVALIIYWRKSFSVKNDLQHSLQMDEAVYTSIDDLLDGFKEAKLSDSKAEAILARVEAISRDAAQTRGGTQVLLAQNFVFSQTAFYLLLATMVFVVPMMTSGYSDVVQKSTTAVLFIIGPIAGLIGSIPIFANASAAADAVMRLEDQLTALSDTPATRREQEAGSAAGRSPFAGFQTIELRNAVFRYRTGGGEDSGHFSIGPINLRIERGSVLFITGGNGSGKSTLLRLLTGLYPLHAGEILVDGKPVRDRALQDYRELFSAVFGDFHLFSRLYGVDEDALDEVSTWLETLEIDGKVRLEGDRFSTTDLSSGQRKRLALIGTVLDRKPILVLDEWAADQDPMFRRKFYREIIPALRQRGLTLIAVTHDNRFFDAADQQMHMEDGLMGAFNPELFHD
jgi:putative pyoverdin transport system ATP-binding/permease protein